MWIRLILTIVVIMPSTQIFSASNSQMPWAPLFNSLTNCIKTKKFGWDHALGSFYFGHIATVAVCQQMVLKVKTVDAALIGGLL